MNGLKNHKVKNIEKNQTVTISIKQYGYWLSGTGHP